MYSIFLSEKRKRLDNKNIFIYILQQGMGLSPIRSDNVDIAYQSCQSTAGRYDHLPDPYQEYSNTMKGRRAETDQRCSRQDNHKDEQGSRSIDYPFSVFGLKRSASQEDMKREYRRSILSNHPDKNEDGSDDEFIRIQVAYEYYKELI